MLATDTQTDALAVTATHMYDLLRGDDLFVLDVRNPDDYARWRIEGRTGLEQINLPYYSFIEDEEVAVAQVPADREVLVVCAKEGSSRYVAEVLRQRGVAACYLQGGIMSWGNHYDVRPLVKAAWGSIVQVARPARGDLSFVVISQGQAAVIDPLRHAEPYLNLLADTAARVAAIFDTHVHADHISGGPLLARRTGAPYYVHPYDAIHPMDMLPARIAYTPVADGHSFAVGAVTLTAHWFPGHTLGQLNYRLVAPDGTTALFTGDGIFLRSFGRPDLGGRGEAWMPLLYTRLFERLPRIAQETTLILPAHFSTLDEGDSSGRFAAPYGTVQRTNDAFVPRSPEQFASYVLNNLPSFPPQYVEIKRVNLGLTTASEQQAEELELGKNSCALA